MKSKYTMIVGLMGVGAIAFGARVASAGGWGNWVDDGNLGSCASPGGFVDDNGDSDHTNYSLWVPDNGFDDQIHGQATKASDGSTFCSSAFFGDGQSVGVQCGQTVAQYHCQTKRN